MAKHAGVPKFGQWDNGNTRFTTFFEVARQGRDNGQKVPNPYDAFNSDNPDTNMPGKPTKEPKARWKEDVSHVHADAPGQNPNPRRATNDAIRQSENPHRPAGRFAGNSSQGQSSAARPQHGGPKMTTNPRQAEAPHHKGTSVPKFGAWEDINSTPGDGYTMTFDNLKKEREGGGHNKLPPICPVPESLPQRNPHNSNNNNNPSVLSKIFCCLNP